MSEYTNDSSSSYASSGVGTAGLTLGVIGTALASGLLGGNGLGGLFGSGSNNAITIAAKDAEIARLQSEANMTAKVNTELVDVYTELRKQDKAQDSVISTLNSRILALETAAPLREQIVVDQISALANSTTASVNASNAAIAGLQATIANLTKTIIPADNVCPKPMPEYNSWTAPTTTATTA